MAKYEVAKLRNLGLVAQGDAGKTSLAEAMLFTAGMTDRLGRVDDGSSVMDFEPEEVKRKITLVSSFHHCTWNEHELVLADTPGYTNFLHDTRGTMRVLDGAIMVLSAVDGVKAQTQAINKWADEFGVGRIAFVNKIDRERADFRQAVAEVEKILSLRPVFLTLPIGSEDNFKGVVDLVTMKAHLAKFDGKGSYDEAEIPAEMRDEAEEMRLQLVESAAETDETLMEKYLEEDNLSPEDLLQGLRQGTLNGEFLPVLCGSATANVGVRELLDAVVTCLPSPEDRGSVSGVDPKSGDVLERSADPAAPFAGLVFKTISDPYAGKLSLFRVYSGTFKSDANVFNTTQDCAERIGQILKLEGKKQKPTGEACPGEIVAVAKLKETKSGDTLCDGAKQIRFEAAEPLKPVISFALEAKNKGDEDKIFGGLQKLMEEDPSLAIQRDEETKEMLISGMGQIHVEVAVDRLKRKYGVDVLLKEPKVPYRETIKKSVDQHYRHKKQSGGRGQFADVHIKLEPRQRGEGYEFVDKIVGGVIPRQYIPAVDKGIQEVMHKGPLGGFPVQDFRVTLYDGQYHSVDSSEMAFKIAGSMAFKRASETAVPILLEPIMQMEITVPDECVGDVIGDMNSRRGRVLGMDPQGGIQIVSVQVPMSEVLKYAPELRSMTSDRGAFAMEFSHYEEVPSQLADKLLAELNKED